MAKVVCQAGPDAGHEYPLSKERTVFGRRSGCEVQIMDSMASREHFEIRQDGRLFTLIDLESRNGTKVNERKVTERQLDFGDRIRVGEVEYLFVKEEGDVELKDLLTSKYEIQEKVGEGGMGLVYKAVQRSMDRTVALKVLAPKYAARPKFVQRFIDEARSAGRLNHPNIIQVHDVDTENGIHYFSMEFIEGGTCSQFLKARGTFAPSEALEIVRLTGKALQYAHENRLIHRDVKPDNIMVSATNMVKLADLGISKTFDEAETDERPKRIVGTPHYMAPEAVRGRRIDHRVDIYSLGATLYHLLAGRTPFSGKSATAVLRAHTKEAPPSLAGIRPELPTAVVELVEKMMAKEPDDRYPDMAAVIEAIGTVQKKCGLGADIPSTGDTLMLRRFAAGEASGSGSGSAEHPSPEPRRPASSATGRRTRGRSGGSGDSMALVKWAVVVLILVLGGILASQMIDTLRSSEPAANGADDDSAGSDAEPARSEDEPGRGRREVPTRTEPAASVSQDQQMTLRRLQERFRAARSEEDLRTISRELTPIEADPADATVSQLASSLREDLSDRLAEYQAEAERERFRQLRTEVERLHRARDYEGALSRLAGFSPRYASELTSTIESMRENIATDRDNLITRLNILVDTAVKRSDGAALRKLRDEELPESMVDSELARKIDQALSRIDQATLGDHQELINEIVEPLRLWKLEDARSQLAENEAVLSAGPLADRHRALAELTAKLAAFVAAFDAAAKAAERPPRIRFMVGGIQQAEALGMDEDALLLEPPSGGDARVLLHTLGPAEIIRVGEVILGEEGMAPHVSAIERQAELSADTD